MKPLPKKYALPISLLSFLLTLTAFLVAFIIVIPAPLEFINYLGFFLWSAGIGIVFFVLVYFKRIVGFILFSIAFIFGVGSMLLSIISGLGGWGNLVGVFQFIGSIFVGVAVVIVVEGILLIIQKLRK